MDCVGGRSGAAHQYIIHTPASGMAYRVVRLLSDHDAVATSPTLRMLKVAIHDPRIEAVHADGGTSGNCRDIGKEIVSCTLIHDNRFAGCVSAGGVHVEPDVFECGSATSSGESEETVLISGGGGKTASACSARATWILSIKHKRGCTDEAGWIDLIDFIAEH